MPSKPSDLSARLAKGLDPNLDRPIARQLAELLFTEVLDGTLVTGARLPTVRGLAIELSVHPGIVERAFDELEQRGVLERSAGGVFVRLGEAKSSDRARALDELCVALSDQAGAEGFDLDELIDGLIQLRADRRSRRPK